jgi:hypothetical protein
VYEPRRRGQECVEEGRRHRDGRKESGEKSREEGGEAGSGNRAGGCAGTKSSESPGNTSCRERRGRADETDAGALARVECDAGDASDARRNSSSSCAGDCSARSGSSGISGSREQHGSHRRDGTVQGRHVLAFGQSSRRVLAPSGRREVALSDVARRGGPASSRVPPRA